LEIKYLSDNSVFTDVVAKWIYDEFIDGIREGVSYEKIVENFSKCQKDKLPVRLVAIVNGECAGTVSIEFNDLKCRDYTPWLSSLYVEKTFRGKKIGDQLIDRVKEIVKELGYSEVYLRTEHASEYYIKRNWEFVESCTDEFGLEPDVFKSSV